MKSITLNDVKGYCIIRKSREYVFCLGKELNVFRTDGSLVFCGDKIKYPFKFAFFADDRLLIEAGGYYYLLSWPEGTVIWQSKQPSCSTSCDRFALDAANGIAYDILFRPPSYRLVRIDLGTGAVSHRLLRKCLPAVTDIMYDKNGNLCLLECGYCLGDAQEISENGILCCNWNEATNRYISGEWKAQWQFSERRISKRFFGNAATILTEDLCKYSIESGILTDLRMNCAGFPVAKKKPLLFVENDDEGSYLIEERQTANIVYDVRQRCIAAQYASKGGIGCVIDNAFWQSTEFGIIRKPFPAFEDIPPEKNIYW